MRTYRCHDCCDRIDNAYAKAAERHDNRQQAKNEGPVGRGQLASRLGRALSRASRYDDPFSYLVMIVEDVIEDLREAV